MQEKLFQYADLKKKALEAIEQFDSLWRRLDLDQTRQRLGELEQFLSNPDIWNDPDRFTPYLREKSALSNWMDELTGLKKDKKSLEEWLELTDEEQSPDFIRALSDQLKILEKKLQKIELKTLLSNEEDKADAILEIHPGAGGTEAQDWAEILLRMYTRWAEDNDFKTELLDFLPGEEAGVKSVTLGLEGSYAYGLLKGEQGIHRLIRISPFDSSGRRHTSFASVDVYPDLSQEIQIEVRDEDLRVDVFRSSGPGGQSVNKTSSAVRLTHLPSGIVVQCQNEKSQHRNKDAALKILKAKLYEIEIQRQEEDKQSKYAEKSTISWGSQIRTYTLQPYRLIKDHRTNSEEGNVEKVLDGGLNTFIRNYLLYLHSLKGRA
ncbi:MAG: peptide chain release factor 2 [Desulfohalobiaceae bacterium]|nr:peptide chain release factor 2 [Desulfohalobiaceae bacterium]